MLGTFVEITVPQGYEQAAEQAFAAIAHVHRRMSFHDSDSDLARLREAPPGTTLEVDEETVAVLRTAVALYRDTGGLFDVGVGRSLVRSGFLPRERIARLDGYCGTSGDIEIVDDRHVRTHRGMLIDLGGIAKGYAVDRAVEVLTERGVGEALVNAGGDLRAFGARAWPVGLRDAHGKVRFMVPARNCAVASSSNLDNRRRVRGREESPHVGRGGKSVLADHRVTVIAPTCIIADALTKVALADHDLAERVALNFGARLLDAPDTGVPS
ncbi:MAG: FAD:protein FMN transferase [Novosphingobium sp.]|uniref:FAD:protein FMN transferase n=1 Tax=Novosphingobium sp. TaxID=1874826 RepID=UPI001E11A98A|nr:FAD:protein FMN transferase [Novosphingobium sp.]MCB2057146.1 FAD:protein FMN transferase [Novosphingobium sp.]MCP5385997.1 FAD:protein FMN transferase [Novosphingobium sp.]